MALILRSFSLCEFVQKRVEMNSEGNSIKDGSSDKPPDELVVLRNGFGGTLGLLEIVDIVLVIIQSGVGKIAIWRQTTMKKAWLHKHEHIHKGTSIHRCISEVFDCFLIVIFGRHMIDSHHKSLFHDFPLRRFIVREDAFHEQSHPLSR